MAYPSHSQARKPPVIKPDPERAVILGLSDEIKEAGGAQAALYGINLYVSLKSKPLAVIIGPEKSGKLALVEFLSNRIIGKSAQFQMMVGHPFWASNSPNVAMFTEAQARFNTEKVISLVEEAWAPNHSSRLFLGCLARISHGELETYFASAAFQLGHGELMTLPYAHFNEPIPFPRNLLLIGTMDVIPTARFSSRLLDNTSLIYWPEISLLHLEPRKSRVATGRPQTEFLRQSIRSIQAARRKLSRILNWGLPGLEPVQQLISGLEKQGKKLPSYVLDNIIIYLANAWSRDDVGLFSMSNQENLATSLDFAIGQYLLPSIFMIKTITQQDLEVVANILEGRFLHAYSLYKHFLDERQDETLNHPWRDPVCGMQISPLAAAGVSEVNERSYYFCALTCKQAFDSDPGKYISA